ncbi:mitochondrial dicarboxylate carrier [Drosophila tropicalis]|uniref:mitochondrial dicarboxylate carrier n=1 Tax=Drosophila tropicalis TaxID=46794 RepID=UPI0035AC0B16
MMVIRKDKSMIEMMKTAIKNDGILSLYDGLSAQLLRQLTYTALRFHIYELGKQHYVDEYNFIHRVFVASIAGPLAGCVGVPTEVVNTRMHVDRALPKESRLNYQNVFDGLYRIYREEGCHSLYNGWALSCIRAALLTIGQNAVYDQAKLHYMKYFNMDHDNKIIHLMSSTTAACICAPILQPIEVLKTLKMNAKSGYFKNTFEEFNYMMRFGIRGLFRGMVPSLLRLVPNTIIIFLVYEQLRLKFGYYGKNVD